MGDPWCSLHEEIGHFASSSSTKTPESNKRVNDVLLTNDQMYLRLLSNSTHKTIVVLANSQIQFLLPSYSPPSKHIVAVSRGGRVVRCKWNLPRSWWPNWGSGPVVRRSCPRYQWTQPSKELFSSGIWWCFSTLSLCGSCSRCGWWEKETCQLCLDQVPTNVEFDEWEIQKP